MDESSLHELMSGRRRDVGAQLLRGALSVASVGYSAAMTLRNKAYDLGLFAVHKAGVPVISLGNITTGGTGKTPTAAWLTNWLVQQGRRPGLLSRGYRSLDPSSSSAATGNDEKLVLDRLCPGVPHLQQRDRVASARRLVGESQCDILILDDGFQHRRLHRDLDLVLIDALQPWGYGHVLPRGLLRESLSGLRRASLVAITRADQVSENAREQLKQDLRRYTGREERIEIAFEPQRLIGLDGVGVSLDHVAGRSSLAFCGIGNPSGFRQTLASLEVEPQWRSFPDHHHYSPMDLQNLTQAASAAGAECVLTTLKDLVKIPPEMWSGPPLFAVEIGVRFLSGESLLIDRLRRLW